MQLVDMEFVQFGRPVLDDPILHVAVIDDNIRHGRARIEANRSFAIDGQVELDWASRVARD